MFDNVDLATSYLETLLTFRQQMYHLFTRRRDALFDLTNASLTAAPMLFPLSIFVFDAGCYPVQLMQAWELST